MASCAKVLLSECITIGLQKIKVVLLGVPKVVSWLVLVGVNECILIKVKNGTTFWKNKYFPYFVVIFCWGQ